MERKALKVVNGVGLVVPSLKVGDGAAPPAACQNLTADPFDVATMDEDEAAVGVTASLRTAVVGPPSAFASAATAAATAATVEAEKWAIGAPPAQILFIEETERRAAARLFKAGRSERVFSVQEEEEEEEVQEEAKPSYLGNNDIGAETWNGSDRGLEVHAELLDSLRNKLLPGSAVKCNPGYKGIPDKLKHLKGPTLVVFDQVSVLKFLYAEHSALFVFCVVANLRSVDWNRFSRSTRRRKVVRSAQRGLPPSWGRRAWCEQQARSLGSALRSMPSRQASLTSFEFMTGSIYLNSSAAAPTCVPSKFVLWIRTPRCLPCRTRLLPRLQEPFARR